MAHIECCQYFQDCMDEMAMVVEKLTQKFDDSSILGKDRHGTHITVSPLETKIEPCVFEARGFCVRILDKGHFFEYSMNNLNDVDEVVKAVVDNYQQMQAIHHQLGVLDADPVCFDQSLNYESSEAEIQQPLQLEKVVSELQKTKDDIMNYHNLITGCQLQLDYSHCSSSFVSNYKQLSQGYIETQLDIDVYTYHQAVHKQLCLKQGMEILDELDDLVKACCEEVLELEDAKQMVSGTYDVICDPYLTGRMCHEAFGHDALMDQCLKGQSEALSYLGKQVASPLIQMVDVGSYLFDDEGNVDEMTYLVKDGIFVHGLYDQATASRMGTTSTGNGRRANYASKAYARMSNIYIEKGTTPLDTMISSISDGYLLENLENNTVTLKNWQEQAILCKARRIQDGQLTDDIYAPVLLSSSVLELLRQVDMVSEDFSLYHHYTCDLGDSDGIKVGIGGPYLKTKARLG